MLGLLKGMGIIIGIELALISCPLESEIKLRTPVLKEDDEQQLLIGCISFY